MIQTNGVLLEYTFYGNCVHDFVPVSNLYIVVPPGSSVIPRRQKKIHSARKNISVIEFA